LFLLSVLGRYRSLGLNLGGWRHKVKQVSVLMRLRLVLDNLRRVLLDIVLRPFGL